MSNNAIGLSLLPSVVCLLTDGKSHCVLAIVYVLWNGNEWSLVSVYVSAIGQDKFPFGHNEVY